MLHIDHDKIRRSATIENRVGGFFDPVEPFGGGFEGIKGCSKGLGNLRLGADA
jgi:hypothetical protein